MRASKVLWRAVFRGSRAMVHLGCHRALVKEVARWNGGTPLINAAVRGNVAAVKLLLEAAADPTMRNDQGYTPLEAARVSFGGEVPLALQTAFNTASGSDQGQACTDVPSDWVGRWMRPGLRPP